MVTGDATRRHSVCMTSVRGSSRLVHKIALLLSIESVLAYAMLIEDLVIGDKEEEDEIDEAPEWSQKSKAENEKAGLVREDGKY